MPSPRVLAATLVFLALSGCASAPAPPVDTASTTVVLLPDEDGNVGAILITNASGSQRVDQAFVQSRVDATSRAPSAGTFVGQDPFAAQYAQILKAQPPKPASFILYFDLGSTALTAESKAMLPAVLRAAAARKPTEISVFGFADALGTEKRNDKLSQERAEAIAQALRKADPDIGFIEVEYFGSRQPLVPTPPKAAEARNRRAEVMIL